MTESITYPPGTSNVVITPGPPGPIGPVGPAGPPGTVQAAGAGTASAPSITFAADSNTGFYNPAPDTLGFATGGAQRMVLDPTGLLAIGTGDNPTVANPSIARQVQILEGTTAAPITGVGPSLKVVRTIGVTAATIGLTDGADILAALHGQAHGVSDVQPIGVFAHTDNTSALPGNGQARPDATGVYTQAHILGAGVGAAIGAFVAGRRLGTSTAARAHGVELWVVNGGTTSDHAYNATGANPTSGMTMNPGGNQVAVGILMRQSIGTQFDVGLGFSGQVVGGKNGSIASSSIRDDSTSVTSLDVRGTHTTGLSLSNATLANAIVMSSTQGLTGGFIDVPWFRPTGNVIEQRNATTGQTYRVYRTYTDASNYERLSIGAPGSFQIATEQAAPGVARNLIIGTTGSASLYVLTNNVANWLFSSGGHFLANTDSAVDIGAVDANRPRNIYQAGGTFHSYNPGAGIANDTTNFERLELIWSANSARIQTTVGGTGVGRELRVGTSTAFTCYLVTNNLDRWCVNPSGVFHPLTNNAFDIGATSLRPRNIYVAGAVANRTKAGTPVDADVNTPTDGMLIVDTTASKIWARIGGVWKQTVALT